MRARIVETNLDLGNDISLAASMLSRMKGLLGKKNLGAGKGLLIHPCKGIHTFFMKFPIDVVILDKDNRIIALFRNFPKNRMTPIYRKAQSTLELPAGTLNATIDIGHHVELS